MLRALVVEDELALQDLYSRILNNLGYETTVAENGAVAIDTLQHDQAPNLIVLDIRMPIANGLKVLEFLQSYPNVERIHVVIASATQEYQEYCGMLPSTDFLLKPVLPADLQAVAHHISEW